jgi:hypothetical protein
MIAHVVLMKPRPDLSTSDRAAFVAAFERAIAEIPSVRGVRIGRRVVHGATYESLGPDVADVIAIIEFNDRAGLQAYLAHPAHADLGARFYQALSSAMVFDFEVGGLEMLQGQEQG